MGVDRFGGVGAVETREGEGEGRRPRAGERRQEAQGVGGREENHLFSA
jgi:hypothetical protein